MDWILLTASFGAQNYHDSAVRLLEQSKSVKLFANRIHVNEENLKDFAPTVTKKYSDLLNPQTPGHGYFAWKPEIVNFVLNKYPRYGVAYIDAGCELNSSLIARMRLKRFFSLAKSGSLFHVLNYPERAYTKRRVLDYFTLDENNRRSPQIQATWFFLCGEVGRELSNRWLDATLADQNMIDDSKDSEDPEYIGHRYDQSLLSCVVKSMKIKPSSINPCYRPVTFASRINCYLHPIWSSRNRSGISIQSSKRSSKW